MKSSSWEECLKNNDAIISHGDIKKIDSLIETAFERIEFADSHKLNEK